VAMDAKIVSILDRYPGDSLSGFANVARSCHRFSMMQRALSSPYN
jgi:hypothetical protein